MIAPEQWGFANVGDFGLLDEAQERWEGPPVQRQLRRNDEHLGSGPEGQGEETGPTHGALRWPVRLQPVRLPP